MLIIAEIGKVFGLQNIIARYSWSVSNIDQLQWNPDITLLEGPARESVIGRKALRGKWVSGITKREIITIATFNDNPWTKTMKNDWKKCVWEFQSKKYVVFYWKKKKNTPLSYN